MNSNSKAGAYDKEGFLRRLGDWDESVAEDLAKREGINLSPAHWEVIELLRVFYRDHQFSPANKALVQLVARELGAGKGRSIYLMKLFKAHSNASPAKIACKIAGLPRPENCL